MISSASHDSVSRLVAESLMCLATASDKAFENIDCMIAILRLQAKNRFYESTQRLIQLRRVLWAAPAKPPLNATIRNVQSMSPSPPVFSSRRESEAGFNTEHLRHSRSGRRSS